MYADDADPGLISPRVCCSAPVHPVTCLECQTGCEQIKDVTSKFFCVINSRMLSNLLLTDSQILGLHYGSEKVTRTNMITIA